MTGTGVAVDTGWWIAEPATMAAVAATLDTRAAEVVAVPAAVAAPDAAHVGPVVAGRAVEDFDGRLAEGVRLAAEAVSSLAEALRLAASTYADGDAAVAHGFLVCR